MAALAFSEDAADIVTFRKAIFRMILSRARARLTDAVFEGAMTLKEEIDAGKPVEEQVRQGAGEKLGEVLALLARFRR